MTHVFIIPEPHLWDKTFKNRKSYPDEVMGYMQQVMEIISGYEGKRVIIFPGDIFHRSYGGIDGIITTFNLFKDLNTLTDNNVFSCVGNHELSFTYNNPFWIMAEDYTTRYVNLHGLKAFGTMHPGIKVVDELDIEDIRFLFGHYCRKDLADTSGKDLVFITHNSLLEPEIDKYVSDKFGIESKTEYMHTVGIKSGEGIPVTEKLKYVFVGHMHTFFGKFNVEENVQGTDLQFLLQYMGSFGRTSISEVNNVNLARVIPHFAITEDSCDYVPIDFMLKPREDIVLEQVVLENAAKAKNIKTMRQLVETSSFGDTPEQRIDRRLAENPFLLELFHSVYSNELNADITDILKEVDAL